MRSLLPLLAASTLTLTACGSSPETPSAPRTAPAAPATTAAPTPPQASPVSVLGAGVTVSRGSVAVDLRLRQPADADPPTADSAQLTLPAGIAWHGEAAPSCTLATIRAGGAAACPDGSVLGHGRSTALVDRATSTGEITVVNGGPGSVLLATVVRNPAYVKSVVTGRIAAAAGGGLRVDLRFPPELQTIAGVPVGLQRLQITVDRGAVLHTSGCTAGGDRRYRALVAFADGTRAGHAGTASCRER